MTPDKAAQRAEKRAMLARGLVEPQHGTPGAYQDYGCRCEPCTEAWRAACARRMATPYAPRSGEAWTDDELARVTARGDDGRYLWPLGYAAERTGRTRTAIMSARRDAKKPPPVA